MGAEAACTVRFDGRVSRGKALLETSELIFRGDFRLVIPFSEVSRLTVSDGDLTVAFRDGTATFSLGATAAKWAEKIRNPRSRLQKLGVKDGQRIVALAVRDSAFIDELRERDATLSVGRLTKEADLIFLGGEQIDDLAKLPDIASYIRTDGAVWTITPKGKGGVKDTDIMELARAAGLVAVKVVSFSDTHSANKFVIPKARRASR